MKLFIYLILFFVSSFIECQIFVNRAQLAAWIPTYATETTINLNNKDIFLIDSRTFSNLNQLYRIHSKK